MSDQLTEEDRKVSIDRLVSALKGHGDSNMSEKDVVELAAKTEEVAYTKHPTNKKEYFSIIASKLMRITQRTTQKQPASAVPMPMSSNIGVSTQPMMGMNMNMPPGGMFTAGPAMGMPIQRTNISVSGTASNPIAISTNAISNNPNPMNMGGYTTAVAPKPVTVPQPAVGAEDADWDKYTEKHNQLATRYVTILEQMMKQFEKASDLNPSFETFKNRIQNFYRILKEPNFRPAKTPEESIKALEVMEKNIESWVHSITQRKGTNPATHLGAHPAQPPVHPQPHTQPLSSHPQPPTAHLQPHTQPPTSHPQPPIAHPQAHAQPLHSQPPHIQQPHVQPQPPHPPASIVSPPAAAVPMPLPTQPAIISPQPTPQPPIQPEKSPLPPQASPPIASPSFVPMQPIVTQAPPTVIRTSEESHESSVEEFFTPGIITGFLDKLSKTSQDLKEMKTVLERITKIPTTDDASNAIQSDDSGLPGKSLKPPTSAHHKRLWWSRDSNSDWNKVKEEKLKSSDGFSTFGLKRAKKNDEALSGVDADFSGMHPIFPAVAKAVRGLMKNPEARSLKRVFKSVDENKLFIELVMEEHKPEAATSAYLMQLELFPDQKINNQVSVGVTVKRTVMDKAHDSVTSVFMPALIELQALSHSSDTDADKWIGFLSCYKRYLEQYNALFSQIEELQSCGYDITSSINHDATALLSCRLDSQVLVPALQVIVYLDGKTCKGPEIQYSEEHDLFLQDVKANLESKIRSLSRVVQQPTLPLILSAWKSIVELQYL